MSENYETGANHGVGALHQYESGKTTLRPFPPTFSYIIINGNEKTTVVMFGIWNIWGVHDSTWGLLLLFAHTHEDTSQVFSCIYERFWNSQANRLQKFHHQLCKTYNKKFSYYIQNMWKIVLSFVKTIKLFFLPKGYTFRALQIMLVREDNHSSKWLFLLRYYSHHGEG